jgi:hypothetical protein
MYCDHGDAISTPPSSWAFASEAFGELSTSF